MSGGTDVLLHLGAAVALLLWGVRMIRTGVTRAFGAELRRTLSRALRHRVSGMFAGVGIATLLQSSTATAVLVGSFTGRGLLAGVVALGVMLGADVGTTLAAQLLSLDLAWLGPLCMVTGVLGFMGSASGRRRQVGRILIGVALTLLALGQIGAASAPLRETPALAVVLGALEQEPLLAVLLGAVVTWAAHSSLAMVLLFASLAGAGTIDPGLGVALVLGANLGGAATPFVVLTGEPPAARRPALGNLAMRAVGVVVVFPVLGLVTQAATALPVEPGRALLMVHTGFNVAVALAFLPLLGLVDRWTLRVLPDVVEEQQSGPRFLDETALSSPSLALAAAAREALRLSDDVSRMLDEAFAAFSSGDPAVVKAIERADDEVDCIHEAIVHYLTEVSKHPLGRTDSRRYVDVLTFSTNLEHIGDIIDKNLMELARKKIRHKLAFSDEGRAELEAFHARVVKNLQLACNVFLSRDPSLARQLVREKAALRDAARATADAHYLRVRAGRPESIETSTIHLDVIRDLQRINSHATAVAYAILEEAGELSATRLREHTEEVEPDVEIA